MTSPSCFADDLDLPRDALNDVRINAFKESIFAEPLDGAGALTRLDESRSTS